jgi:hypothetical protein
MYPVGVREMGIQEARPVFGDLVRDAQREAIRVVWAVLARIAEKERDAR